MEGSIASNLDSNPDRTPTYKQIEVNANWMNSSLNTPINNCPNHDKESLVDQNLDLDGKCNSIMLNNELE